MRCVALACALLLFACQRPSAPPLPQVEIGVFFGGQIQRLKRVEVSFVRPPKVGFRVEVPRGDSVAQESLSYEIVRPGPAGRRVTEKGNLALSPGDERIDHVLDLDSSSKLGLWNVRVVQGTSVLADRALYLVEAPAGTL